MAEDLETVIEDSLNDAGLNELDSDVSSEPTEPVDSVEDVSVEADATEVADQTGEADKTVVAPIVKGQTPEEPVKTTDEAEAFAKKWGIPVRSVTGRENRLPHSRVRTMIAKNTKEVTDEVTKKLTAEWTPKYTEVETKVKDYESKLQKVGEFENYLYNQPREFLELLSQIPAYKPFFDHINKLAEQMQSTPAGQPQAGQPTQQSAPALDPADPRPGPNRKNPDGSMVYDMEGLDALLAWQARQVSKAVKAETIKEITARYAPIEQERELQRRKAEFESRMEPVIAKQLADAQTWPHFKEHKAEILKVLEEDQSVSLEGAYNRVLNNVVMPRLSTDRNAIRAEILAELKRKPASTTAPVTRSAPSAPVAGPRTLEQVIEAEIAKLQS